ncbi:hypothetical protein [Halococcus salifodinae]|uniref:hypothetical protein n=1 Tax=Halococcus salifodinae TaxID=36738 RepID=UPI001267916D|nr:hypothetical protein [Halococcus salifodinae]
MASTEASVVNKLRQPEYTGENRCYPCTYLNVFISVILSSFIGLFVSPPTGGIALVLSLVVIYLRGYIIPGTPTITQQYFPDRVLQWFGKAQSADKDVAKVSNEVIDSDLIEYSEKLEDLKLVDEVKNRWHTEIRKADQEVVEHRLKSLTKSDEVELREADGVAYVMADNEMVLQRRSRPAIVADIAILPILSVKLPSWERYSLNEKSDAMRVVRMFMDDCPACGSDLTLDQTAVESCCTSKEVYTLSCPECKTQMSEMPVAD